MAGKPQIPAWKAPLIAAAQARRQVNKTAAANVAKNWAQVGNAVQAKINSGGSSTPLAPPASQSTAPQPPPYEDSTFNTAVSNLQGNLGNIKSNLVNQGVGLGQEYGIDYTGDPVNGASGFSIDKNVDIKNPFSRAALLKRSYEASSRGDGNQMAARGQLYSGAYQNAQNTDTRNYEGGQDSLLKDFQGRFGGLLGQWLQAQGTETAGEGTASSDAIGRWIAAGSPAPPTPQQATTAAKTAEKAQAKRAAVQNKNKPLRRH